LVYEHIDIKGIDKKTGKKHTSTSTFMLKKKLMKAIYGIDVSEFTLVTHSITGDGETILVIAGKTNIPDPITVLIILELSPKKLISLFKFLFILFICVVCHHIAPNDSEMERASRIF
jgi:hypothetical protein